jgi:hypothetical protein
MTKSVESHNDPEALKNIIEQNNAIAEVILLLFGTF